MMLPVDIRLAFDAIRAAKWRSFLTMLGVVIGVASVVTVVGIGMGVKNQVAKQVRALGADMLTIRSGKTVVRDSKGDVSDINVLQTISPGASMSDADYQTVLTTPGLKTVVPIAAVAGVASVEGHEYADGVIIGTTDGFAAIIKQKVAYGGFFGPEDKNRQIAVIGQAVAERLFEQTAPIGRALDIRGQTFVVAGVFDVFPFNPLNPAVDYNQAIFIPYDAAKNLNQGDAQIQALYVRPADGTAVSAAASEVTTRLKKAHGGREDFAVLRQEDNLVISDKILGLLTLLISAVAAISLLVGGVGIMNILLVSISERTHEIGVRKAIGATSGQIMRQFLAEAASLSLVGSMLGLVVAGVANYFLRLFTSLQPVLNFELGGLAIAIGLVVGVFFGVTPAIKAARMDPIEALRRGQ